MLKSMTGFGKSSLDLSGKTISIEIKSLNSKQLDVSTRITHIYNEKELEIRTLIAQKLIRGKIFINFQVDNTSDSSNYTINSGLAKNYFNELSILGSDIKMKSEPDYLSILMRMPEVMKQEKEGLDEEEWKLIQSEIIVVLGEVDKYRIEEGNALTKDIEKRKDIILSLLKKVEPLEQQRMEELKHKILKDLNKIVEENHIDKNRFEQELIYYLEKFDITEEKIRLKKHCEYFSDTINDEEANGKKLGFIAQEIGREVNTIGSKANHADIQRIVVQMKDELEKIKEQMFNIL